MKGIPLGYQAMGIFYNWKLMRTVPHLWNEIGKNDAGSFDATEGDGTQSVDDAPDYTDIMLGLGGKYVPGAPDILSLFLLQNSIPSYDKLADANAAKAMANYFSFSERSSPSTLAHIASTMKDLNLTTVDMFVRGKIGMVIGYPSLLREIEYSIKRA